MNFQSGADLVVEHRIVGSEPVTYHLALSSTPSVAAGPGESPDVIFTQDRATAEAIESGRLGAHDAILTGRLKVDGDVGAVRQRGASLASLDQVFERVRAQRC